jgi:DNA-binding transcriptional MerR regulator
MLKIGDFAKRAAVSVKTLRFYDHNGVLRPAHIDPKSRYRYYRVDQLAMLSELRLLRELGGSMEDLKVWVATREDPEAQWVMLRRLREKLQNRLGRDRDRLRYIDHWTWYAPLWRRPAPLLRPGVRSIAATPALTLRDRISTADQTIYRMFEFAERAVARLSARASKRPSC